MNDLTSQVADRMKEKMAEFGLKQADLCRITGLSRNSMSTYFLGKHLPDTVSLYKIATALQTNVEWLLTGHNPKISYNSKELSSNENNVLRHYHDGTLLAYLLMSVPAEGENIGELKDREKQLIAKLRKLDESSWQDIEDFIDMKYIRATKNKHLFANSSDLSSSDIY